MKIESKSLMRQYLLIALWGTLYFFGVPICCADDLVSEISPSQVHRQVVNQELDKIENSGNIQTPVVPSVSNKPAATRFSITRQRSEFEFGSESYWARYQQPGVFHQKGFMTGYETRFTYRTASPKPLINMYRLEGQWAHGKFDYQSNDGFSHIDGIKDDTYEIRGLAGKELNLTSFVRATGYSGFGYRYLKDNPEGLSSTFTDPVTGNSFTALAYETVSHYCYIPFGADILYQTNRRYSLASNLEFDYMVRGWEVSKLGVVQQNYNTTVNGQNAGIGLRASLRLNLYFKYFDAYAETFFRYWNIGRSDILSNPVDPVNDPPLYIPRNNTEELGFRLGLEI